MKVTHYFTASLTAPTPAVLYAVKGDGARMAVARLMAGAEPWTVPEGVTAGISYTLPDKTPGYYDRLEDGTPACMIAGNLVSAVIAPVLTGQAGAVKASIVLRDADGDQVATFPFQLRVEQAPGIVDAEGVPAMGNGFEGKLFYGGPGGALTALALGDGVRVEATEDGTLALVAEGGSGGGGGIDEEKDPTVPAWAKQPQKPTYTAQEVGALPAGTKIPGKTSELTNDAGFVNKAVNDLTNYYTRQQTQELIAAIPRFRVTVVQQLPAAGEELVLYLVPFATAEGQYLEYIWVDGRWEIIGSQRVDLTGYATEEWVQEYVEEHSGQNVDLTGYAKEAWVQEGFQPKGNYASPDDIPRVPNWAMQASKPTYTASEVGALPNTYTPPNQTAEQVGADPKGTAASAVSAHNTNANAHNDIRQELSAINARLTAFFDSDNQTLDELSEIVAYITSNKSLIDAITTSKVSVADIVNNLTTNVANKPLSAAQGVAIKALIDGLASGKLDASKLPEAINTALAQAKASGEFDGGKGDPGTPGKDGYTPQIGKDYWTPTDKAEIEAYIAGELAKRGQLKPEFAQSLEWLEANGDTSKLYVLPDGYIYAYIATVGAGESKPNFTNVMDLDGAYVKAGNRYSHSSAAFKACTTDDAVIIPITSGAHTVRVRGAGSGGAYTTSFYYGENNQTFSYVPADGAVTRTVENNGDIKFTCNISSSAVKFCVFHVQAGVNADTLIVTVDQEITYTTTPGGTTYKWTNTGHHITPADYEDRIIANEQNISSLQTETKNLADRLDGMSINAGGGSENIVFSLPAFAPVPQKAPTADGGGIMDVRAIRTNTYYEYMDTLVAKHPNYLYKQYMGRDASDTYDHYRYIACRSYYHAWVLDNYPRLFGWKNGNTVVYSVSVSPRVGDAMYSTPYIGSVYGTVAVVNCTFDPVKASTRTVSGVEFERYAPADVEPTVVYTTVKREYEGCTVYNSSFASSTTVSNIENGVMTCADGKTYTRYPFEDKRNDKSKPLSIFILSNEHAGCNWGDSSIVSIIVAQFLTDMCENKNIPFLRWLKDNCMITTIPIGNPWGYSEDSIDGYNNSNGVNINRNYDTPGWHLGEYDLGGGHGEYAGSESETQHIMNTVQLSKAHVCLSMHGVGHHNETPTQGGYAQMQGQGFDHSIRRRLEEILTASYNLGLEADITDYNDPYHTGKSPSYFQWAGAVGGLTETVPWNALTGEYFDAVSMEAGYTEMLLFLQCWIKEALEKMGQ